MVVGEPVCETQGTSVGNSHRDVDSSPVVWVQVRVVIAKDAGINLAKAATIATRYSILRRQGFREGSKGKVEHQVTSFPSAGTFFFPPIFPVSIAKFSRPSSKGLSNVCSV